MIGSMVQVALGPASLDVPVILGGGIGCGSQLLAALAMGCEGILMGTRMMVADESIPHGKIKDRIIQSDGTDTVIVQSIFNHNHRVMSNAATDKVLELEHQGIEDFDEYRPLVTGDAAWNALQTGNYQHGMIDMGQSACFANTTESAGDIITTIIDEATDSQRRLIQAIKIT